MQYTVADIYAAINALAPFDTAMQGDNVGLLVGKMDRPVDTVLTAVDATPGVVREAQALGAQLLVTHHPLLFSPIRQLNEAEPETALLCDMVRAGLSMIAAHTNLDAAPGGVNDAMVAQLGWHADYGHATLMRAGALPQPMTLEALEQHAAGVFGPPILRYGNPQMQITRFALCSGSGGAEVKGAAESGAQVFITGEIKHNQALEAMARGMAVLACGHRATEISAAELLANHLQSSANAVKLKVRVFVSKVDPFT